MSILWIKCLIIGSNYFKTWLSMKKLSIFSASNIYIAFWITYSNDFLTLFHNVSINIVFKFAKDLVEFSYKKGYWSNQSIIEMFVCYCQIMPIRYFKAYRSIHYCINFGSNHRLKSLEEMHCCFEWL